jgi:hypothetical protein
MQKAKAGEEEASGDFPNSRLRNPEFRRLAAVKMAV